VLIVVARKCLAKVSRGMSYTLLRAVDVAEFRGVQDIPPGYFPARIVPPGCDKRDKNVY